MQKLPAVGFLTFLSVNSFHLINRFLFNTIDLLKKYPSLEEILSMFENIKLKRKNYVKFQLVGVAEMLNFSRANILLYWGRPTSFNL